MNLQKKYDQATKVWDDFKANGGDVDSPEGVRLAQARDDALRELIAEQQKNEEQKKSGRTE